MKDELAAGFNRFIKEQKLLTRGQRVLLAVSGGMDSSVLTSLVKNSAYDFGIAHINFGLRAKESDADETFVKRLAGSLQAPFFSVRFDTAAYAVEKKISLQMAARELRYAWLEETRKQNGFHAVAVAHHLQDLTETMLINLLRGTGIDGLHGMLARNGRIIRPLIFASHADITSYAHRHKLKWRSDSSNEKDDYTRNLIRHHVLPVFKKINPSYEHTFGGNADRFFEASWIVNDYIENIGSHLLKPVKKGQWQLPKAFFKNHPAGATILYGLLKQFDFTGPVIHDISRLHGEISGKKFFSPTHEAIIDRELIMINSLEKKQTGQVLMKELKDSFELEHDEFTLKITPLAMNRQLFKRVLSNKEKNVAYADAEKIKAPFAVRTWKKGDVFYPFGMIGKKKVSDFYIDLKLSLTAKEETWLLTDAEKIIWVMAHRLDNRVAISDKTKFCYRLEYSMH